MAADGIYVCRRKSLVLLRLRAVDCCRLRDFRRLEILPPQGDAGWLLSVAVHTHPSHPRANPASGTNLNSTIDCTYSVLAEACPGPIRGRGNNFGNTELHKRTAVGSIPKGAIENAESFDLW